MGIKLKIDCFKCRKIKKFRIGQAINDNKLEVIIPKFSIATQNEITSYLKKSDMEHLLWDFQKKVGMCNQCKEYMEVSTFNVYYPEEKHFVDKCSCGNEIIPILALENIEGCKSKGYVDCPECGEKAQFRLDENWD